MLLLVEERPLQILGGDRPELLRRDRLRVEVEREQLGADQQARIGKISVRDRGGGG